MDIQGAQHSLARLPVELQSNIASHLTRQDLFHLLLTSRRLWAVMEPQLWNSVRITDEPSCTSIREAIKARPALAQAVSELELCVSEDKAKDRQDDGIYSDLAVAASLSNLKHLKVQTACREHSPGRSREAFDSLSKLQCLESCDLYWQDENGENWKVEDLSACFSLIYHPTIRQVRLRGLDSGGNVTPKRQIIEGIIDENRATPMQKLSLLNCDFDPRGLAELLDLTTPAELEVVFWNAGQYPPISTDMADPDDFIQVIQTNRRAALERLAFYRNYDRDEDLPIRFEGCKDLKYLSTSLPTLCGADSPESDSDGDVSPHHQSRRKPDKPVELSLPPLLEVLDVLIFDDLRFVEWDTEVLPFLKKLKEHQERGDSKLQELRFRTRAKDEFSESRLQELEAFGSSYGLAISASHLPVAWEVETD